MRPEGLERFSHGNSPLHRLDARIKLIAALALVIAAVATPIGAWRAFGTLGLALVFLIGLAGIPPRELARRWLGLFLLVGFLAVVVAPAHPAREHHSLAVVASSILIKNGLALLTMLLLAGVTPFPRLLGAMRKLGVPRVLISTLEFMDRYRHVLLDELDRMATARRARTFSRRRTLPWSLLTGMIGILFLRTFERAERVHNAMIARGWQGVHRSLDDGPRRNLAADERV
jgi:cobalt/nickel transport system permease protein